MSGALLAEFTSADELLHAGRTLREKGYRRLDAFSPFPLHDAEEAFGLRRSRLPLAVVVSSLLDAVVGLIAGAIVLGVVMLVQRVMGRKAAA